MRLGYAATCRSSPSQPCRWWPVWETQAKLRIQLEDYRLLEAATSLSAIARRLTIHSVPFFSLVCIWQHFFARLLLFKYIELFGLSGASESSCLRVK
jgi:hypothetical protein